MRRTPPRHLPSPAPERRWDGDAAQVVAASFHFTTVDTDSFTTVDTDAHLQPELPGSVALRETRTDGSTGSVEHRQHAVAGTFDELATAANDLTDRHAVEVFEKRAVSGRRAVAGVDPVLSECLS